MTPIMKTAYVQGVDARNRGMAGASNPYEYLTNLWSCWIAGWNDQDMSVSP